MVDFCIGIASYKRAYGCKTLDYLESIGFPKARILFSVQTQGDLLAYTKAGIPGRVGKFLYKPACTAAGNRNTILRSIEKGKKIVLMDDDVVTINELHQKKLRRIQSLDAFEKLVTKGYALARKHRTICWGLYPVEYSATFLKHGYESKALFTTQMMGLVYDGMMFADNLTTKEDFDFCCRVLLRYGACVRLNDVTVHAPKSAGGCEDVWKNKAEAILVADVLCATYPELLRPNPRQRGEVLLKSKRMNNDNKTAQGN